MRCVLLINNVQARLGKGALILSGIFLLLIVPLERIAAREAKLRPRVSDIVSAREQLRRRGSF